MTDKTKARHTIRCGRCNADNPIVNACGCDPNNLPTRPADDSGLLWYVHAWRAPDETETVSAIVLALTEAKAIAKFTREFPCAVVRCVTPQTDVIETPIN